ncbi:Kef-type K+ transport system membrane component KefB/Trk K+ transport system NAD-binding subunit [Paenibacillus phyllosphaerae]|uniref:Kef-type K+ transport system membrane component KefB/Trk K+ transport system NAD-binding subunit n=1 Tax=Paenibacillus phyllosphaerae TaxID=274593 RepID=A0A7W5B5E7_9BACL|nr:cation:proton antiporter family protein [Paenibacillus phyllosphaerae]MBB3114740.1 Kef-type K+ transport system membrane component KefB/Trk K+ transport system NAD-binding subunit [Paenibacillus phyllosphaerae]
MHETSSTMSGLIIVVGISFIIPIVLYKLRLRVLPVVVAEIIAGLIIGKSGLQLISGNNWLELLSLLGFIYLMFLSGLEIDFSLAKSKPNQGSNQINPLVSAIIIFCCIFLVSSGLSLLLQYYGYVDQVFLTTLMISTVSLGVVVPVLKERGMLSTNLGQTLLLVTVLADFFTMILLAVYVSALSHKMTDMLMLVVFFVILGLAFIFIRGQASGKLYQVLSKSSIQFSTRAIFALLLGVVSLSEKLGVENILGAFMVGIIVSMLKPQRTFVHQLESFGYGFLIPIFFIMVGVNLEIRPLLTDPKTLTLIPLLLVLMFIAKFIPMLYLKRWFSFREVLSSAFLLSSKLSLVIAAATLALELNIINKQLHGAFILVAIVSCLLFPVLFNKLAPRQQVRKQVIAMIGLNHITIPVSKELMKDNRCEIHLYTANWNIRNQVEEGDRMQLGKQVCLVPELTVETLLDARAFEADIIIAASAEDHLNAKIGTYAKQLSMARVIVRIEEPELHQRMRDEGLEVFSTLYAARRVLLALIEHPGALRFISEDEPLGEILVDRAKYVGVPLMGLPIPPHVLVLRIYRGHTVIIPNGRTAIQFGDRLLLSGSPENIEKFRQILRGL